jgi:hypothetical protein
VSEFDKLHAELDAILAKAMPIANKTDEDDADRDAETRGEGEGKGAEDEDMMKSFRVTLDDGREVEAYDATAMMKAMHTTTTAHASALAAMRADLAAAHNVVGKQTQMLKAIADQLAEQGAMLKALREQPAGRKSAAANPTPAGGGTMDRETVLAKALSAQKSGALSSMDVATIEARLNGGVPLRPEHLAAIQAA